MHPLAAICVLLAVIFWVIPQFPSPSRNYAVIVCLIVAIVVIALSAYGGVFVYRG